VNRETAEVKNYSLSPLSGGAMPFDLPVSNRQRHQRHYSDFVRGTNAGAGRQQPDWGWRSSWRPGSRA
jgi:hypothetical protein